MLREGRGRSGHGERGDDRDTDRGTVWVPVLFMGSGSIQGLCKVRGRKRARIVPRGVVQLTGWGDGVLPGLVEDAEMNGDVVGCQGLGDGQKQVRTWAGDAVCDALRASVVTGAHLARRCRMEFSRRTGLEKWREGQEAAWGPGRQRAGDQESLWGQGKSSF